MFSVSIRKLLACAAILAALPVTAGAVTLTSIMTIDFPDASSTFTLVKGVNDSGQLVGEYWTPLPNNKQATHAFYYDGTDYHNIDRVPSSNLNEAWGINNAGLITAGGKVSTTGPYTGYYGVYTDPISFIDYTHTGATNSELFDVNDSNIMVGGDNASGTYKPFMYDLGTGSYTDITVPWGNRSAAVGINNNNLVVGSYWNATGTFAPHGYLFDDTGYTQIDVPNAFSTTPTGINDSGLVVGYFKEPVTLKTHGFLYDVFSDEFTTIDLPIASRGTHVYDISNNGMLVGGYYDAIGNFHGFTATIVPLPPALLLFGSGLAGLFGMSGIRKRRTRQA